MAQTIDLERHDNPSPNPAAPAADPRRWIALAIVLSAGFMVLLGVTIVNVDI